MNRHKKLYTVLLVALLLTSLLGCSNEPEPEYPLNNTGNPSFVGIIKEIADDYIAVQVTQSEDVSVGDLLHVNRNTQGTSSTETYRVGDRVQVTFDGKVATSYPGKILTVYNIFVLHPAST